MLGVGTAALLWVHGTPSAELWQVALAPGFLLGLLRLMEGLAMWLFGVPWRRATRRQQFIFSTGVIAAIFVPILVAWIVQTAFP